MAILVTYIYPQLFFKSTELSAQAMGLAKALAMTSTIHNDTLYKKYRVYQQKTCASAWGKPSCLRGTQLPENLQQMNKSARKHINRK